MSNNEYLDFEYIDGFYGGAAVGGVLIPQDLQYYRTTIDNIFVFHWDFLQEAYVPGLKGLLYELQIDTVNTFDSVNLQKFSLATIQTSLIATTTANIFSTTTIGRSSLSLTPNLYAGMSIQITGGTGTGQLRRVLSNTATTFTVEFPWTTTPDGTSTFIVFKSNVQNFQNGNEAKGFQIQVPTRLTNGGQTWYAQVRTLSTTVPVSEFSIPIAFVLIDRFDLTEAENLINDLADYHVYNKDVVKLPENQRNTLLWKIMLMYGKEFDRTLLLKELVRQDNYLTFTRDENLYNNWGIYFNFIKPSTMQFVDYRRCLQSMIDASLHGSTNEAIMTIARCFTGVGPLIETIRDIADFFLTTIMEQFTTSGTTNVYLLTQYSSFLTNTLILFRDGPSTHTLLAPNVDYFAYEDLPGFTTLVTDPAGDTLTAFYEISEPEPLLFDSSDGLTYSGTLALTHGSTDVFGTGTDIDAHISIGDQISDGQVWETVQYINGDFRLTLTNPWIGDTEVIPFMKLNYTSTQIPPNHIWDRLTEMYGVLITIENPAQFSLNQVLIEQLISLVLPAHIKVFFIFN